MDIQGKTIWITGASSGIGRELGIQLAQLGARLILSARSEQLLLELKEKLPQSSKHIVVPIDLTQTAQLVDRVKNQLIDNLSVDILINNGGISHRGSARNTALDVHREVMETNYFGAIAMTQVLLPTLLENKGMVVTVSSVAGKVGGQSMSGYAGSKHAIIGYMDCLRAEESINGLQVLTICPGFVNTNISINARTENGEVFGEKADSIANGISPQSCAEQIINAISKNRREVVIGKGLSALAPFIKRLSPSLIMTLAAKKNIR